MSKIFIQGTFGAYSHLAALEIDPNAEVIPCKTFDECFKKTLSENNFPIALNFTRDNLSTVSQNIYHHIGIYSYKISILEKFIGLEQTNNEKINKLEQMRALDNKLNINVALAKSSPIGVDTKEDYLAIKKIMEYKI